MRALERDNGLYNLRLVDRWMDAYFQSRRFPRAQVHDIFLEYFHNMLRLVLIYMIHFESILLLYICLLQRAKICPFNS